MKKPLKLSLLSGLLIASTAFFAFTSKDRNEITKSTVTNSENLVNPIKIFVELTFGRGAENCTGPKGLCKIKVGVEKINQGGGNGNDGLRGREHAFIMCSTKGNRKEHVQMDFINYSERHPAFEGDTFTLYEDYVLESELREKMGGCQNILKKGDYRVERHGNVRTVHFINE